MKTESTLRISNVILEKNILQFFCFLISFMLVSNNANDEIPQAHI